MADAHVRDAIETDSADLGKIQAATWAVAYGSLLPPTALATITPNSAAEAWRLAIAERPSTRHRVLTAFERTATAETTVGFAAIAPVEPDEEDVDGAAVELVAMLVEPRWGRRGHGSRLLSAVVAHARAGGAGSMVCWVLDGDIATNKFLESAGWQLDGWTRSLDTGDRPIRQHRFTTHIDDLPPQR